MPRYWTDNHGEDGLRRKFDVYKPRDMHLSPANYHAYPPNARIGADGEFIFVLRPETDRAAYEALRAYAVSVAWSYPQLSQDIDRELRRIRVANDERTD